MKICNVPTAYVLLNSDLGSDESIIADIKRILSNEGVDYEVQRGFLVKKKIKKKKNKKKKKKKKNK